VKNTLELTYTVSSFQVDPQGRARLTTLANFLQETAYKHADSLQLGYRQLADNNSAWILSRLQIRVLQYPDWDEVLTVETWPRGIEKLFALRDFRIRNSDGKVITEASTSWLMVDAKKHRPMRIPPDFIKIETRTDSVFDQAPGIIALPGELEVCDTRTVKYADLDVVGHVNNVKYIEWCTDSVDPELLMHHGVSGFSINFISEARLGEQVEIRCSPLQKTEDKLAANISDPQKSVNVAETSSATSNQSVEKVEASSTSPKATDPVVQKMYISGYNLDTGRECFQAVLTFPPSSQALHSE
jgi:medium-chain acyl-[acyl-carrier-protein] hydrolase